MDFYNFTDNFILWGLISACVISYIPQYKKIYDKKNTLGINECMVISGFFSCYLNVIGSIQENYRDIVECHDNCYERIVPTIQISSPLVCSFILYMFFIAFYNIMEQKRSNLFILDTSRIRIIKKMKRAMRCRAIGSFILSIVILVVFFVVNHRCNYETIKRYGQITNGVSGALSLIMWYPQLYTTYRLKDNYSLSLLALTIHAVGCIITISYQLYAKQDVWIILCYLVSLISETIIVILSLYYKYKKMMSIEYVTV